MRRPKTTKEVALHNNQLLQQLLTKLAQMAHPAVAAAEMAGWSQAMHEQPQAPRMSPQEVEEATAKKTAELLHRVDELEEAQAGGCCGCKFACKLNSAGHLSVIIPCVHSPLAVG